MTPPTRGIRILGMILLFTIPVAYLVESWLYAVPAIWVAMVTGGFLGEIWHRWRVGQSGVMEQK